MLILQNNYYTISAIITFNQKGASAEKQLSAKYN